MRLRVTAFILTGLLLCRPGYAADAPTAGEVEAVLGNQDVQAGPAPDTWLIDGQSVTMAQLLSATLPEREKRLQTMRETIGQRVAASDAASSAGAIEAKRTLCQKTAPNSIDRTKCYQELSMLRDAASQSSQTTADERQDAENQIAKLDQDIAAIEAFKSKYGDAPAASPMGLGSMPFK